MYVDRDIHARAQLFGVLDRVCQELELTEPQYETARRRYERVGDWLGASPNPLLAGAQIYAHGSVGLRTSIKPIGRLEYDVDLICFVPRFSSDLPSATLKKLVGDRLRENGNYANLLEEKPRCWRLSYANEFHLDITPAISNPSCRKGGELVPDKLLKAWKSSNPRGYRRIFEERAKLQPRVRLTKGVVNDSIRAGVEPFPEQTLYKGILRRAVQLCKRHRDIAFEKTNHSAAPISIIITTLLSRSYAYCAESFEYECALDLLMDVVKRMPHFIDQHSGNGNTWIIWNESTSGENFAEKWNVNSKLPLAFFGWHKQLVLDIEAMTATHGLDQMSEHLSKSFGSAPVSRAMDVMTQNMSAARKSGLLSLAPVIGLSTGAAATKVQGNTFFGAS